MKLWKIQILTDTRSQQILYGIYINSERDTSHLCVVFFFCINKRCVRVLYVLHLVVDVDDDNSHENFYFFTSKMETHVSKRKI